MRKLMGGFFLTHPEGLPPVKYAPILGNSICKGVEPFAIEDEQYICSVDIDRVNPFLMANTSERGATVAGWTRFEGDGLVCVLTPGHTQEVLLQKNMQRLLKNAAEWCLLGKSK